MRQREPLYRNLDGRRSSLRPASVRRWCRIKVPERQGAFDLGVPEEFGKQEAGVEGGTQSKEAVKGEKRRTDKNRYTY